MTIYALFLCAVINGQIQLDRCSGMLATDGSSQFTSAAACETDKMRWYQKLPASTKRMDGNQVSWNLYPNAYPVTPICMKKTVPNWEPAQ